MKSLCLQKYLNRYCPTLVSLSNLSDGEWRRISDRFARRWDSVGQKIDCRSSIDFESTIYDVVMQAESGQAESIAFLGFIEILCQDLKKHISQTHFSKLGQSINNLLSNFDVERSCYLDPIGELAVLLTIITESQLQLSDIESELPTGRRADFCFTNKEGGGIVYVEVLNIHFQDRKIQSELDLTSFLSKRLEDKLSHKLNGQKIVERDRIFTLLPVVWCNLEDVNKYVNVFELIKDKYQTLSICALVQARTCSNEVGYRFMTIKDALKIYNGHK